MTLKWTIFRRSWESITRTYRSLKLIVGTTKKSIDARSWACLRRNVRHVWDGFFDFFTMYLLTVASDTSKPSFNSSPCILGAQHSGLVEHIVRIRFLISGSVFLLPVRWCDFHFQNILNPALCHRITVSGFTIMRASFQLRQA